MKDVQAAHHFTEMARLLQPIDLSGGPVAEAIRDAIDRIRQRVTQLEASIERQRKDLELDEATHQREIQRLNVLIAALLDAPGAGVGR